MPIIMEMRSATRILFGDRPLPGPRGQVYLTDVADSAAIGELQNVRRRPAVFALALVGPMTDAADPIAIFEECLPDHGECSALEAAYEASRFMDRSESGRRAFKIDLVDNATGRSGHDSASDHLQ